MSDLAYAALAGLCILGAGIWLLQATLRDSPGITDHPLRPYVLQILGLTFILPVVMVAVVAGRLNDQALSALLGAMIAFVFGNYRSFDGTERRSELKRDHSSASPFTPTVPPSGSGTKE
jgi:hypothetical protein